MKKFLLMILSAALFIGTIGTTVFAAEQSGECGYNLMWTYSDNGTLTISGAGDMDNTGYSGENSYTHYIWISALNQHF